METTTNTAPNDNTSLHKTNQEEQSYIQSSMKELGKHDYSKEEAFTNEEVKNTPFRLVHMPNTGYFLILGNARISNIWQTKEEVEIELYENQWSIVCNMICTMFETLWDIKNNLTKQ